MKLALLTAHREASPPHPKKSYLGNTGLGSLLSPKKQHAEATNMQRAGKRRGGCFDDPLLLQRDMMQQEAQGQGQGHEAVELQQLHHKVDVDHVHVIIPQDCGKRRGGCCHSCLALVKHWAGVAALLWVFISLLWLVLLSSKIHESEKEIAEYSSRYGLLARAELVRPPGMGDRHALSSGWLQIDLGGSRLCYNLLLANYSSMPTGLALHGPLDDFGPERADVFLELPWPNVTLSDARLSACQAGIDSFFLESIVNDPSAYYLVVSSKAFPGEAARGYLGGVWPQH